MADEQPAPHHVLTCKHRIVDSLTTLSEDLTHLLNDLSSLRMGPDPDADRRAELADMLQTYITLIEAEFTYLNQVFETSPDGLFDVTLDDQPGDTAADIVADAAEQFTTTVRDVPAAVEAGELDESDYGRFFGRGFGHSYGPAIDTLARRCANGMQDAQEEAALDTAGESADSGVTMSDAQQATTSSATGTDVDAGQSTATQHAAADRDDSDDDGEGVADSQSVEEHLTTPEGDREPLATNTTLPADITVQEVTYSMVLDPPCKYAGCPGEGRYLVTFEDEAGVEQTVRVCSSDLPEAARPLAEGSRLWKTGNIQTEGDRFSLIDVSNPGSGGYEWRERHAISQGDEFEDPLATVTYTLRGETLGIAVMDYVGDHRREGQYSVEIDGWEGATPIVEGTPIGDWLITRAKQHRKRLLENEGVERHLVSIDRDQAILTRAKQAYRKKNPEFSQPSGLINDHTPVVDSCIPMCAACGRIVAGITLDDAEACEYCGSDEARWGESPQTDAADTDAATP